MTTPIPRRTFLKLTAATALATTLPPTLRAADALSSPDTSSKKTLIAHRGNSGAAPENTLPAYERAIRDGADYVEQDLHITKDGILICSHDATLERTTNVEDVFPDRFTQEHPKGKPPVKRWYIHNFTLKEIKQLDAGSSHSPQFKGTTIPTWQEAIDAIRGKAGLCPETKSPEFYGRLGFDMEQLVSDTLKHNNLLRPAGNDSTPILFQSFSKASLLKLRDQFHTTWPLMQLGFVGRASKLGTLADVKQYAYALCPYYKDITAPLTRDAHALGLKIFAYTFVAGDTNPFPNVTAQMSHYLYDLNIDGLFTNNPDQFPRHPQST